MTQKAGELAASDDSEFTLEPNGDGRPAVMWRGGELGVLEPGKTLLQPVFKPAKALNGLEGSDLAAVTARAETWLTARIDKHLGGVTALLTLSQTPVSDADGGVLLYYTRHRAAEFAVRLMLHGARVELPMVVCVLPGPPHPQCCTFAGAFNAQLLPLPPAVATMLRAAPPTSPSSSAAAPPAPAMITLRPRPRASEAKRAARSGVRCADITKDSWAISATRTRSAARTASTPPSTSTRTA